jgi:DNA repair protein RadC
MRFSPYHPKNCITPHMALNNHNIGHRARLKERILKATQGNIADYELLESILHLSIPRRDTKPLAKELIAYYGSFGKVIYASEDSLSQFKGIGNSTLAVFRIIQESVSRLTKEEIINKPIISCWKSLLDYCRSTMGHSSNEQFRVLYLDNNNALIADELQDNGTVNHVAVYPREIAKAALNHGAVAMILVHNHPSGNTKPSNADIELTKHIAQTANLLGISVHDHIIISSSSHYSFKAHGLL